MPDQRPTKATSIVLPAEFIDRAEALVERIDIPAELQAGGVRANRSVVLRMAIAEGLKVLEQRHAEADATDAAGH